MKYGIGLALLMVSPSLAAQPAEDPARHAAERALFKQVIETPTVKGNTAAFRKLTTLLTGELKKAGFTSIVVKDHDGTQTLIGRRPAAHPSGKKPIVLLAHMDVVEAKASDWKNPPFEMREEKGYYLGRGTADMKSGLVGLVLALQQLNREGFQSSRDLIVLFTGDEETDMTSARRATHEWRDLIDAEYGLNFDGGGGTLFDDGRVYDWGIQIAEKTYADYKLVSNNRGGHSSRPRPDNAIYAIAGALKAIEDYRFEPMINDATRAAFESAAKEDKGSLGELVKQFLADPKDREVADLLEANSPGSTRTRCVATMMSGGHAPNALPQHAEANVNCRIFPGVSIEQVRTALQSVSGPDVTVTALLETSTPASAPSPVRADIFDAEVAALKTRFPDITLSPYQSAGASDGSYLRAIGIPVYGAGVVWGTVGQKTGSHGLDEKVRVDAFHGQVPIIADLLRRLAG